MFGSSQQPSLFGTPPAGGPAFVTGSFSSPQGSLFNRPAGGSPFGSSSLGFGASAQSPGFGTPQTTGFGTPQTTGFGTPQTTGFGTPQATAFGTPQTTGFGTPQTTGFGAPSTSTFGTSHAPTFGQPSQGPGGFGSSGFGAPQSFGSPGAYGTAPSTFGTPTPGFGAGVSQPFASQAPSTGFGGAASTFGGTPGAFATGTPSPAFGGSSALGQSQPNAFGGSFGSNPAFGSQSSSPSIFGASGSTFGTGAPGGFQGAGSTFGSSSASGFGTAFGATPAASGFGASFGSQQPTGGFGSSFGGTSGGFGTSFGATGGVPAFGTPSFGSSAFGTSSAGSSLFGSTATPAFGQQASFGHQTVFGQPAGAAPVQSSMFGTSTLSNLGTRGKPYSPTKEPNSPSRFVSITAMPAFSSRSLEELRFEDYFQRPSVPTSGSMGIGTAPSAAPLMGFGTPSTSAFGTSSAPAFGASISPSFGVSSGQAFGTGTPSGGFGLGGFGSTTASSFAKPSAFGSSQPSTLSTPSFGGTSLGFSGFGSSSGSGLGFNSTGATTGGFGALSQFGTTSTPSMSGFTFGATPASGAAGFSSQSPFGSLGSTSLSFGTSATGSSSGGLFGIGGSSAQRSGFQPLFGSSQFGGTMPSQTFASPGSQPSASGVQYASYTPTHTAWYDSVFGEKRPIHHTRDVIIQQQKPAPPAQGYDPYDLQRFKGTPLESITSPSPSVSSMPPAAEPEDSKTQAEAARRARLRDMVWKVYHSPSTTPRRTSRNSNSEISTQTVFATRTTPEQSEQSEPLVTAQRVSFRSPESGTPQRPQRGTFRSMFFKDSPKALFRKSKSRSVLWDDDEEEKKSIPEDVRTVQDISVDQPHFTLTIKSVPVSEFTEDEISYVKSELKKSASFDTRTKQFAFETIDDLHKYDIEVKVKIGDSDAKSEDYALRCRNAGLEFISFSQGIWTFIIPRSQSDDVEFIPVAQEPQPQPPQDEKEIPASSE